MRAAVRQAYAAEALLFDDIQFILQLCASRHKFLEKKRFGENVLKACRGAAWCFCLQAVLNTCLVHLAAHTWICLQERCRNTGSRKCKKYDSRGKYNLGRGCIQEPGKRIFSGSCGAAFASCTLLGTEIPAWAPAFQA